MLEQNRSIRVLDLCGKEIYSSKITEINLGSLTKGICVVKVSTDHCIKVEKIIIE